jgi:hypothetical protein
MARTRQNKETVAQSNREKMPEKAVEDDVLVGVDEVSEPEVEENIETVLSDINEVVKDLADSTVSASNPKVIKTDFALTDMIPCKSLYLGTLIYTSPTNGARYKWNEFGSVLNVPFGELQTMNNHKPQYMNKPYILITVPEVVEYFNLNSVYANVANINKLDSLFATGNISLIVKKVKQAVNVGMREAVVSKILRMRQENKLVDINIIKALKAELKFDIESV